MIYLHTSAGDLSQLTLVHTLASLPFFRDIMVPCLLQQDNNIALLTRKHNKILRLDNTIIVLSLLQWMMDGGVVWLLKIVTSCQHDTWSRSYHSSSPHHHWSPLVHPAHSSSLQGIFETIYENKIWRILDTEDQNIERVECDNNDHGSYINYYWG